MSVPVKNFIIIDDDSCHNIICSLSLKKAFDPAGINIIGYTNALAGIRYLEVQALQAESKTVLFLDVNMPNISGWDVLSAIDAMPTAVKNNLLVYMLSSSVTESGKTKAFSYSCVKDYIEKPLADHLCRISKELLQN